MHQSRRKLVFVFAMLCLTGFVTVSLSEAILRLTLPLLDSPVAENVLYVWPPNIERRFLAPKGVLSGIEGSTLFSTNSLGIRGDEISDADRYRILCIGGSTTECMYLDDDDAWPKLLQKSLNRRCGSIGKIWVGNIGRSALNAVDHVIQMKRQLPTLPRIDCIVLLVGINDCVQTLMGSPDAFDTEKREGRLFRYVRAKRFTMWPIGQSAVWSFAGRLKDTLKLEGYQDDRAKIYVRKRTERASVHRFLNTLPNLDSALRRYRDCLRQIKQIADSRDWRLILLTQPTMWRKGLTAKEKALLWLGDVRDSENHILAYYSVDSLARAIGLFNSTLKDFCAKTNTECIDLADQVPKNTKAFYDDCHFNESGARIVANSMCDRLGESLCSPIRNSRTPGAIRNGPSGICQPSIAIRN